MRVSEIKNKVDQLRISEKLLLVEDVWDSIAQESGQLPLPEWQKRIG